MTPKSPTPGTDWLASVAAENRERDDELDRLRARVAGLEQERDDYKARLDKSKARYFGLIDFCRGLKETISEMDKAQ